MTPSSPNPYLAYLPSSVEPDYDYWNSALKIEAEERASLLAATRTTRAIPFAETESNDTPATADFITGLGTGPGDDSTANYSGTFPAPSAPNVAVAPAEDNGSITLAGVVSFSGGVGTSISATLGDGPHGGGGPGDFDFYRLNGVLEDQLITVDIDTPGGSALDSLVSVWDGAGNLLLFNDDNPSELTTDSLLEFCAPSNGDYYVLVSAFLNPFPSDPFDSSTGAGGGSEGAYTVIFEIDGSGRDFDHFSFDAEAGDVIGVTISGDGDVVDLLSPSGKLLISSRLDATGVMPTASPLPGGGNAVLSWVASETGRFVMRTRATVSGSYSGDIMLFRPPLETASSGGARQILFIDFDGAMVDTSIFGPVGAPQPRALSPLSSFLAAWGLSGADENAVIDAVLATLDETLKQDFEFPNGANRAFDIEIRNSRDHADPFGQPNVSRVIVGGTIDESGIPTIGIAQSIDPANFETEETALVLLDILSGPAGNGSSLNAFPVTGGATKVDLVGVGVGNIVAHEAGHFFGDFHTDRFFTPPNIMDSGGSLVNTVGIGDDGVFGSGDDVDVDFGVDVYEVFEGFVGNEDTLNTLAFGVTTGLDPSDIFVDFAAPTNGTGAEAFPFNRLDPALQVALFGAAINVIGGSSNETFSGANQLDSPLVLQNPTPGNARIGEQ